MENKIAAPNNRTAFLEKLYNASIDGIMVLDTAYNTLLWNRKCEIIHQMKKEDVVGKSIFEAFPHLASCKPVVHALQKALEGVTTFVPADVSFCGTGMFESHYIPIYNDGSIVEAILCIFHDVARREKTEEKLQLLNTSLHAANRILKRKNAEIQALSHVATEHIKEPLRRIYTSVELIFSQEGKHFSDNGKLLFRQIQGSVQRIGLLVDDILALSKLEQGDTPFEKVNLDVEMASVLETMDKTIKTENAKVIIQPLPVYYGNKMMMAQLFRIILGNAIKFRDAERAPEITVSVNSVQGSELAKEDIQHDASFLHIRFSDNGIGFDNSYAQRIFDPFVKLNKKYPGSGTGLTLARQIAELHGGFITTSSVRGEGSIFDCYLQENL